MNLDVDVDVCEGSGTNKDFDVVCFPCFPFVVLFEEAAVSLSAVRE